MKFALVATLAACCLSAVVAGPFPGFPDYQAVASPAGDIGSSFLCVIGKNIAEFLVNFKLENQNLCEFFDHIDEKCSIESPTFAERNNCDYVDDDNEKDDDNEQDNDNEEENDNVEVDGGNEGQNLDGQTEYNPFETPSEGDNTDVGLKEEDHHEGPVETVSEKSKTLPNTKSKSSKTKSKSSKSKSKSKNSKSKSKSPKSKSKNAKSKSKNAKSKSKNPKSKSKNAKSKSKGQSKSKKD